MAPMHIKNLFAKVLLVFIVGMSVLLPIASFAAETQSGATVTYTTPKLWPTGYWGPVAWCTGSFVATANPGPSSAAGKTPPTCNNLCDLIGTFINAIYLALSIAIFIIAPLSLAVGGIMIMVAGANPEMLGRGKKVLTGAVIGLVIVLCSYLVVNTILVVLGVTSVGGFNGNSLTCSISP